MSWVNEVHKIADNLYCIKDVQSINRYVVVGSKSALLFDTGFGFTDFKPLVREITDKELYVVDSHADPDHALGNYLFDDVYVSRYDYGNLFVIDKTDFKRSQLEYRLAKPDSQLAVEMGDPIFWLATSVFDAKYHLVDEGFTFDLGETTLEVIATPGHTSGSIALVDRDNKRLFTGDTVADYNVYYMDVAGAEERSFEPLAVYLDSLCRLRDVVDSGYKVFPAHGPWSLGVGIIEDAIENLLQIHECKGEEREIVSSLGYPAHQHCYRTANLLYSPRLAADFRRVSL